MGDLHFGKRESAGMNIFIGIYIGTNEWVTLESL